MIGSFFAEFLKFLGIIVVTFVAIYSILTDNVPKVTAGKLTPRGRVLLATALIAAVVGVGAQLAEYYSTLESAETARRRHELTASKLDNLAEKIRKEALLTTPLRRMTLIVYFSENVSQKMVEKYNSLSLDFILIRGGQSEFRITLKTRPRTFSSPSFGSVFGKIQLEGRDQRITVSLSKGATFYGIFDKLSWLDNSTTSIWVDLGFQNLTEAFQDSIDGEYNYWPYRTIADLVDVRLSARANGKLVSNINSMFLRLNERKFVTIPINEGHKIVINNIRTISSDM